MFVSLSSCTEKCQTGLPIYPDTNYGCGYIGGYLHLVHAWDARSLQSLLYRAP